ncbi:imidazolonepropionase, partial [Klebsiella michiganensis]|nr:imidazolonepropionase [Klebsiella michiganensis]
MYTLWHHCRIATMAAGHYQLLDDGAMLTDGAVLLWVGSRAELLDLPVAQRVDLRGRVVTPGLVDCHSHAVFGGDRAREFEMRLNGASYAEIAAGGGGIASTVNATRQ